MELDDLTKLIMKAAADFNESMRKQAYERALPTDDVAERAPGLQRVELPHQPAPAPTVVVDLRWQEQIKQRLFARRLDLERRRAGQKRR